MTKKETEEKVPEIQKKPEDKEARIAFRSCSPSPLQP